VLQGRRGQVLIEGIELHLARLPYQRQCLYREHMGHQHLGFHRCSYI
jgi:hypothetical protein